MTETYRASPAYLCQSAARLAKVDKIKTTPTISKSTVFPTQVTSCAMNTRRNIVIKSDMSAGVWFYKKKLETDYLV
jgi:hypothetical protein